jgi:2-polyprenyl-6-hydroxyphenyl methylase/3-demethylubiquinone-9 3-methyltransferase
MVFAIITRKMQLQKLNHYYTNKLSALKLKQVYEVITPRVQQYLDAEVNHVLQKISSSNLVLELGCGYGRVLSSLANKSKTAIGIDTSLSSLLLGKEIFSDISNCFFAQMNAGQLAFPNHVFDVVVCIQNGISAFHVDVRKLIEESIRVTKQGGLILFSTYSEKFWNHRLEWFQLQSDAKLLGEIDYEKTKNGNIVCKDGFTATTIPPEQFLALTANLNNIKATIEEVDESSLFCEILCS